MERGLLSFSAAGILSQLVQMACGFLVLRWVPPGQMGIWLVLQTAETYALLVRLGVINALNREYPFLLGQGRTGEALRHVQAGAAYLAGSAVLVGTGFAGAAWIYADRGPDWPLALGCFSLHAGTAIWRSYVEATFRGGQAFGRLAVVQLAGAGLHLATLPLVAWAGFSGFCVRAAVLAFVLTGLWHAVRPVRAPLRLDLPILGKLLREGFPLFLANYVGAIAGQFPRLLLLEIGGALLVGCFAPIAALLSVGALIPGVCLSYLLPKQNFVYGRDGDAAALARWAWRHSIGLSLVLLPLGAVGYALLSYGILEWLPEYRSAIPALGYAAAITAFSPLRLATSVFSTLQSWTPMLVHAFIGFVLAALAPWCVWRLCGDAPLVAIMQGTLMAQLTHALVAVYCVRWAVRRSVGSRPPLDPQAENTGALS